MTVFFLMLIIAACGRGGQQDIESQKNQLRDDIQQTVNDLDTRIAALQAQIDQQGANASMELRQQHQNLTDERNKLSDRLDEIGTTTADSWNNFREEVNDEIDQAKEDMRG